MEILSHLRVVEFATEIAGPYCGKLLGDAGADVVKVETGEGDPLRRRAVHGEVLGDRDSALFRFLNAGKRSVIGEPEDDEIRTLMAEADIIIESFAEPRWDIETLQREHPHLVVIAITPYGRRGRWAGRPTNDFIIQAEAGGIAGRGDLDRPPYQVGGRLSEWISGTYAGVSALGAAIQAQRTGQGEYLDCAMIEAVNITFNVFPSVSYQLAGAPAITVPPRRREYPSIEPTKDGWVGFNTNTQAQLENFFILIGRPDLIGDPSWMGRTRYERVDEFVPMVHAHTQTQTTAEIVEAARLLRIPVAPVLNGETVLDHPQFRERGLYVTSPDGDFVHPLPPYMIDGARGHARGPAPKLGAHAGQIERRSAPTGTGDTNDAGPLAGVRVVDATPWWAGPSGTQLLACLGAEVTHIESHTRLDGARTTTFPGNEHEEWWEASPMFLSINANKREATLALDRPEGIDVMKGLIAGADVIVENYAPRVFENFGLTWDVIHEINPRAIFVRMPAFGTTGPWRDSVGFAQTMEQISGMAWVTGYPDRPPRIPLGPCDPSAGAHAAFATLVALERRNRTGVGSLVEATMVEAALNLAAEQAVVFSAHGITIERDGNRSPDAAPQGLYRCAGDGERWLAVSVQTDEQWRAMQRVLGHPPWTDDPGFDTAGGRRAGHDIIDDGLTAWAASHDIDDAVGTLIAAGVPAGEAWDPRLIPQHPLLCDREYFVEFDHPIVGRYAIPSPPFRPERLRKSWLRSRAPLLGEHSDDVFNELGLDREEIEALIAEGVSGRRPPGA